MAPAARFFRPSCTIAWASTVAVVVPSPATSLVLLAASLSIWAPMFWKGSFSSISLATVTPSWVTVGAPNLRSRATLRPLGPRVVLTAFATASTPALIEPRAESLNSICFAICVDSSKYLYVVLRSYELRIACVTRTSYSVLPSITARMSLSRRIRYSSSTCLISVPAYLE